MKLDDLGSPHFPQLRLLHFSARACITPQDKGVSPIGFERPGAG